MEVESGLQKFHLYISKQPTAQVIVQSNKVPCSLAGIMFGGRTFEFRGVESVNANMKAEHLKRFGTAIVVLCCKQMPDGSWVTVPMKPAILIRSGSKVPSKVVVENPHGMLIEVNSTGVINTKFMSRFAHYSLSQLQQQDLQDTTVRVMMDSAFAHISKKFLSHFRALVQQVAVIPGGLTQFCQAVDTDVACVLKSELSALYDLLPPNCIEGCYSKTCNLLQAHFQRPLKGHRN